MMLYAHQLFCMVAIGCCSNGLSTFLMFVMAFHKYQIKLLGYRLKTYGHTDSTLIRASQQGHYANVTKLIKMHVDIKR